MSETMRLSPVNAGLVLASLLLTVLLALDVERVFTGHASNDGLGTATKLAGASPDSGPSGSIDEFRSIADRPLFSSSRRALAAPSAIAVSSAAAVAPPSFDLVGIVAAGADQFVLVRPKNARVQRLVSGQSLDDWQLVAIGSDRATFANQGNRVDILIAHRGAGEAMPVSEPWLNPSNASPVH